jgi:hypothetical protein
MHQRVRCPECHHWTDALLVWAAGDCCPICNAPIVGFDRTGHTTVESDDEPALGPPRRLSQPGFGRVSDGSLSRVRPLNH